MSGPRRAINILPLKLVWVHQLEVVKYLPLLAHYLYLASRLLLFDQIAILLAELDYALQRWVPHVSLHFGRRLLGRHLFLRLQPLRHTIFFARTPLHLYRHSLRPRHDHVGIYGALARQHCCVLVDLALIELLRAARLIAERHEA